MKTKEQISPVQFIEEGQLYVNKTPVMVVGRTDTMVGVTDAPDALNLENEHGIPVAQFERDYVHFQQDFGWALDRLREGKKLARKGWDASGLWVVLMPALYLEAEVVNGRTSKHLGEGVDLDSQPYFAIFTARKQWQPGWVPSVSDCLAVDWEVVE